MCDKLERAPSDYLKDHFWYDSVIYHTPGEGKGGRSG